MIFVKKLYLVLILLLVINALNAQKVLPPFEHNPTSKDSAEINTILRATQDFDFSIVLKIYRESWFYGSDCIIIGYKNNMWYQSSLSIKEREYSTKDTFRFTQSNQFLCDSVILDLKKNFLFTMNTDSLEIDYKNVYNSTTRKWNRSFISISDYNKYTFYIINDNKIRKVYSMAPEFYYREIPNITQRKYFINCKNSFLRLSKE